MARIFRVRSRERDIKTDQERFQVINQAIGVVADSIRREKDALQIRVNEACDLASLAAGMGVDDYLDREPEELARIREYEHQMAQGDRRLQVLGQQLEGLEKIRNVYLTLFEGASER